MRQDFLRRSVPGLLLALIVAAPATLGAALAESVATPSRSPSSATEDFALVAGGIATAAQKCEAAKSKATALAASAELTCYTRAYALGVAVDAFCLQRAGQKMELAFSAAEAKGGCVVTGDLALRQTKVDALLTSVVNEVGPPAGSTRPCAAKKVTAVAKIAGAKLKCWATADARGVPVNQACLGAGEKGLNRAFTAADRKPGCAASGDVAGVLNDVDGFVDGVRHDNGLLDVGEECDDGLADSDTTPDACRTDGLLPHCGDGVLDTGESACAATFLQQAGDHVCIAPDILEQKFSGLDVVICPSRPTQGVAPTCDGAPGCRLDVIVTSVVPSIDMVAQTITLSGSVSVGNGVAPKSKGVCAPEPPVEESCFGPSCDCAAGRVPADVSVGFPISASTTCDAVFAVRDLSLELFLSYTVDPVTGHPSFQLLSGRLGSLKDPNVADANIFGAGRSDPARNQVCGALRVVVDVFRSFALASTTEQIQNALQETALAILPGVF